MPQPRRSSQSRSAQAQAAPPPPRNTAGAAAAAAAVAALTATQAPTPDLPGVAVTAAARRAAADLLSAVDRLFRQRRAEMTAYVRGVVEAEMPEATQTRIDALVQSEQRREVEFQRRTRSRLTAELPLALAEQDPKVREARVRAIMDREKRYIGQRESAAASRTVAALESDLLRVISPEGAFWALSPLVKEHTLDCIAMGGKFWPWPVLEEIHPQLHGGCMCRLWSKREAVQAGLLHPDDEPFRGPIPPEVQEAWVQEAVAYGRWVLAEDERLREQLSTEDYAAAVHELEDLRLQEARLPLRWRRGLEQGGEFRPQRGSARKVAKALSTADLSVPTAPTGAGRDVHLQGNARRIPRDPRWEERINGVRYTSPAGDTSVYRDGQLMGDSHPDMAPADADYATVPEAAFQPNADQGPSTVRDPGFDPEPEPLPRTGPGIPDYTGIALKLSKAKAGGTTGARFATDTSGRRWLVKSYGGDQNRVATELLSNAIYRELGAAAADAGQMATKGDEPDFRAVKDVDVGEPDLPKRKPGQRLSSGIIVRDPDGSIWVYEPKGHFGGYEHTFPKGGVEGGLTAQQNAHKELWEETGLHATITGFVGDFQGDTGVSRYYLATRTGGEPHAPDPTPFVKGGSETAEVKRLSPDEARKALNRDRDQKILDAVLAQPIPEGGKPDEFPPPPDGIALAYPTLDGEIREQKFDTKGDAWGGPSRALGDHYMADALLANWDFVGMTRDNVLWDGDGQPIRIDQGGTLQFRAQGQPKPFGPVPTEVWTMRAPKGQGFGTVEVDEDDMRDQARVIGRTLSDGRIDELVDSAPFEDEVMREEVRDALKARTQWMREFATGEQQLPRPLAGSTARKELTAAQRGLEVYPEEHAALESMAHGLVEQVNTHLRTGMPKDKASPEVKGAVKYLDELLRITRLDDDVYGWMAVDADKLGDPEGLVGKTLRDSGFGTATLTRPTGASAIRVTIPAGHRALYLQGIEGLEAAPRDVEMLMARGARMRVVRARLVNGKLIAEAVIL